MLDRLLPNSPDHRLSVSRHEHAVPTRTAQVKEDSSPMCNYRARHRLEDWYLLTTTGIPRDGTRTKINTYHVNVHNLFRIIKERIRAFQRENLVKEGFRCDPKDNVYPQNAGVTMHGPSKAASCSIHTFITRTRTHGIIRARIEMSRIELPCHLHHNVVVN